MLKHAVKILKKIPASTDTITTKILILVLCCVTIPLIVVGNLSTDIINQGIINNVQVRLETSKKIFLKLYSDKVDKKEIASYLDEITGAKVDFYELGKEKPEINAKNDLAMTFSVLNESEKPVNVVISISNRELVSLLSENIALISYIAVISLIVAIIIAALFARRITDPILDLAEAAESINLGDLGYRLEVKGKDEIAKLGNSFNKMVRNLEKEERLRNNFVATLTHDLKVPMLAENQTVSFLLKETYGPLTEEQKEVLELIKSTNTSSLEMIGTLLEVYRYDSGNVNLFETEFDLVELMKESVSQIKSLTLDKKIELNIIPPGEAVMVKADYRDIRRVIHNLVSNAIYHGIHRGFINCKMDVINDNIIYNPVKETEYYSTLKTPLEINKSALISIEDNGAGIAREDMPYLFKRFSLSKGRKPSGSGLGLYYSYQVITMHRGKIWAESSERGGSVFKFTLPLR